MVKHDQSPTPHQQSKKFRAKPLKGPSIEVADLDDGSGVEISCTNKRLNKKSNAHSSEMLSTAELFSAVGQIWDCASRSLTRLQPRSGPCCSDTVIQKGKICFLVEKDNIVVHDVIDSECLRVQLNSSKYFPSIVQHSLEFTRTVRKNHYGPMKENYIQNFSCGNCDDTSAVNTNTWSNGKSLSNVGITYGLMNNNIWLTQTNPLREHLMSTSWETVKIIKSFLPQAAVRICCPLSENLRVLSSNSKTKNCGLCTDKSNLNVQSSHGGSVDIENRNTSVSSLYSDYFLRNVENAYHKASMSTILAMNSYTSISEPGCSSEANHLQSDTDRLVEDGMPQLEKSNIQGESQTNSASPLIKRPHPLLAKQEHAISGALSGIVVSLCLHPVDTVKTVLQSCQAGEKSLFYIGQSIITERGLSGLYRGISSNITASAPISALYAYTYESVKGYLLPSLAKEYHSVAHCTAGGCASIATSFIYTPSDHIKQQMQVNSQYQNCWNAALRIIQKGGLLSLYAGWRAVLCRNIPHSIIKFYTYESLKQLIISPELPNNQPSTSQTLLCGGLAGSAASLFSTPFDVVKTRLQTQMPGSARKYQNIFNALQQICNHEGVKGLYRGLIPRLVIYMSQGALFFASYEFFKSLLSMDIRHDDSEMLQYKQDNDDDTLLPV